MLRDIVVYDLLNANIQQYLFAERESSFKTVDEIALRAEGAVPH